MFTIRPNQYPVQPYLGCREVDEQAGCGGEVGAEKEARDRDAALSSPSYTQYGQNRFRCVLNWSLYKSGPRL